MTSYLDPVLTIVPQAAFGFNDLRSPIDLKMNNLNHFGMFAHPAIAPGPSSAGPGSMPTLAPTLTGPVHPGASPTYALGTPYSSTSDSSNASSPDIQSLLPPQHSWNQPVANSGSWFELPTPASTFEGTSSTSPVAPWPLEIDTDSRSDDRTRTCHSFSQAPSVSPLLHPGAGARHHPYLPESSMDAHRRALGAVPAHTSDGAPNNNMTATLPLYPSHSVPNGAASLSTGGSGDRPKSGRLGVKRRQKYTRTRTGCLGCRARRIKCDEGHPICRRCTVAKRECVFPGPNEAKKSRKGGWAGSDSDDEDMEHPHTAHPHSMSLPASMTIDTSISSMPQRPQPTSAPASFAPRPPSISTSPSATGLAFDLSQAIPEGYGIGGQPLGWDRALTFTDALSPSNLGFDLMTSTGNDVTTANALATAVDEAKDKWATGTTPMLNTPNFLLPWFPTAQEQSLILHYCANAADLMMAIPQGLNPMLAINLPLALEAPRGMNPAADALRVTLLGIGAVHQAFLLARSGVNTAQTTATFQYAANLRDMAKLMVRKAVIEDPTAASSDAALSAATSLATIDIFFGGDGWQDNFDVAKCIVKDRGGPARILKHSVPTQLADGVTVTPARLLLEILAIYESFGCLTLDEEPSLMTEDDSWWFEKSGSSYEDKSVETLFGMSKIMVHLFSRVSRLLSRVSKLGHFLDEPTSSTTSPGAGRTHPDGLVHIDSVTTGMLPANVLPPIFQPQTNSKNGSTNHKRSLSSAGAAALDQATLQAEAVRLEHDINSWIESLQVCALEHERVQVGNQAYAYAMKILLMRMVFGRSRTDPAVQAAAQRVLQHCSISTAALGMSIDLMWPAIIAGCEVDGNSRQWLLTLLEGFKAQCCFDVETASRIIQETWRRIDNNQPRADWKGVCTDLDLKVLLC